MSGDPRREGYPGTARRSGRRSLTFSKREVLDLVAAWLALGVAFAIFFAHLENRRPTLLLQTAPTQAAVLLVVSLLTAGVGFLLHELAHKVVAVRFGQVAAFRAQYGMLLLAIGAALAGFLFAAPGAVHHRGRITRRQQGLIALAGPVTNVVLAGAFLVVLFAGLVVGPGLLIAVGRYGVAINLLLAGFNMLPFGPLDGATVRRWSLVVYLLVAIPSILLGVASLFLF